MVAACREGEVTNAAAVGKAAANARPVVTAGENFMAMVCVQCVLKVVHQRSWVDVCRPAKRKSDGVESRNLLLCL